MLTRAEAKTKECPLRAAGYWANPNDNISPGEGALNCRAEGCPKWRDIDINGECGNLTGQGEKYLVASSGAPAVLPGRSLLAEMNGPIPPQWLTDVIARTACSLCPKCLLEHRPRCGALSVRQALEVWKALRGKAGMDVPAHGTFPENEDAAVIFPEVED